MRNEFKQHWFCSYSLVTTQLYFSNNLGLVKLKEQNTNRISTIKYKPKRKTCIQVLPSNEMKTIKLKTGQSL